MRGSFRFMITLLVAGFSFLTYWCTKEENEQAGQIQLHDMSIDQRFALGLQKDIKMVWPYGTLINLRTMDRVRTILAGQRQGILGAELFQIHSNPEDRTARLQNFSLEEFPSGLPASLQQ